MRNVLRIVISVAFALMLSVSTVVAYESNDEQIIGLEPILISEPDDEFVPIEPFNQLVLPHGPYTTRHGQWSHPFNTVGSNMGSSMNVWVTNTTANRGRVIIERRGGFFGGSWVQVFNEPLGSQISTNISISTNTEHRIRIEGNQGADLRGQVGLRQLH